MPNSMTRVPAADKSEALAHFESLMRYETDCWDVHESLASGSDGFAVLDVRSPDLYRAGHVPGAINLPHGKITARNLERFPAEILFVVYCAGPHCNGADKAAIRLARLGRPVKKMVGGITGWADEGFDLAREHSDADTGGSSPTATIQEEGQG